MPKLMERRQHDSPPLTPFHPKPLAEPAIVRAADRIASEHTERMRSRRYYRRNRGRIREQQRLHRQDPAVRERLLRYYRDRYRRLRERIREQQRLHRQDSEVKRRTREHRRQPHVMERERVRVRTYYSEHPDARRGRAEYMKEYFIRPDVAASRKAYFADPEVRTRRRELNRVYDECRTKLMPILGSENPFERESAAYSLGSRKYKRSLDLMVGLLSDNERFVRLAAVWALGEINDTRCVGPLVSAAESANASSDWQLLKEIAAALAKINTCRALDSARSYSTIASKHLQF